MDERIDIEVIDKVAKTIKPELLGIGEAAKNAYNQIAKLKRELGVSGGGMSSATRAAATAEREATRASADRARQAQATARALDREAASAAKLQAKYEQQARAISSQTRYNNSVGIGRTPKSAADSFKVFEDNGKIDRTSNSVEQLGKKAQVSRNHLLNLGYQLQDIFVSLQGGQKPLTVFIQQGGQIGQIAAQSGVGLGGMAKAIGSILVRFLPLGVALGAAAGGFALFNHAMNEGVKASDLTKGLGATRRELYKLKDESITAGDTIKAVFQVLGKDIADALGWSMKDIKKSFGDAMDWLAKAAKNTLAGIYATFVAVFKSADTIAQTFLKGGDFFDVGDAIANDWRNAFNDATKALDKFGNAVQKQAIVNARERIKDKLGYRAPGAAPKKTDAERLAERQAEALRKLRAELANEQNTLAQNLVGIDATVADRMNSIADSLQNVKIDIFAKQNEKLRKELEASVTAIEKQKSVLGFLASAYDTAIKPADDWAAAQDAAKIAIVKWGEDSDKANLINKWLADQELNFRRATNPLYDYNRALLDQRSLLKYYGKELEIQTEIQRRYNEEKALQPNIEPDKAQIGFGVRKDAKRAGVQSFLGSVDSAANDNYSEGGNQWLIDNYKSLYAEIARMRDGDLANADEYNRQLHELDKRYMDARLSGTETMLSNLSTLQSSHVREVAAIGKAAAIAQATIDGIRAVQAALAGPPGPPWSFAIAATAGVAAAANVARIAGVGFQKGGYTGDVPPHQAVGAVHGREYVMDAAATARIGVPTLDAIRSGRFNQAPANNNGPVINVFNNAGANVSAKPNADGSIDVLVEAAVERKLGPTFQRRLSDPNSKESRAIGDSFKVRRNRA